MSQNSQNKHLCRSLFLIKLQDWNLQLYKEETPIQVFSFEFCEIFKNKFYMEHPRVTVSE